MPERRNRRGIAAAVAGGAAVVGGAVAVGAAVKHHRDKKGSGSSSSSSGSEEEEGGPHTYAMREKLLAIIADDFTINRMVKGRRKRGKGKPAFYCRNKVIRVRDTFQLQSLDGDVLYEIQERKARVRDAMAIHDGSGDKVAEILKRAVGVVRDNYTVKVRGERNWEIHGSILEHDYTFREGGRVIATIHEKWIAPVQDCYFIDIKEGEDHALVLCCAIALDCIEDD